MRTPTSHDPNFCFECESYPGPSGALGACKGCGAALCSRCAADVDQDGEMYCHPCVNDLMEQGADDEPECECVYVDVDLVDAWGCEVHGR